MVRKCIGCKQSKRLRADHKYCCWDCYLKNKTVWNKGKTGYKMPPASEERKRKVRISLLGHPVSKKSREKMSQYMLGKKGSASPAWRGGLTSINQCIRTSLKYRTWRNKVFVKDNYTCQSCGLRGGKLHADHIKPFSLYSELRFSTENGRTLCVECHKGTGTFGGKLRKYERSYYFA